MTKNWADFAEDDDGDLEQQIELPERTETIDEKGHKIVSVDSANDYLCRFLHLFGVLASHFCLYFPLLVVFILYTFPTHSLTLNLSRQGNVLRT